MSPPGPLFCLTTDFGSGSPYVAELKGVLLSAHPNARLVDVTHDLPPQSIRDAEVLLRTVAWAFPLGATHLVVVDPGVGTARRALALRVRGLTFLGPDNGVLATLAGEAGAEVVSLDRPELFRQPVSPTFHGRDVFAPVAAELAAGLPLAEVGSPATGLVQSTLPRARRAGDLWHGEVLAADRYGNLLSNVPARCLAEAFRVEVAGKAVPTVRTYGEAPAKTLVALVGSDGFVELAVRDGSAAAFLQRWRGVELVCGPARPAAGARP